MKFETLIFFKNIFCSLSLVENTVTQDKRNVKMLTISVVVVVFKKNSACHDVFMS